MIEELNITRSETPSGDAILIPVDMNGTPGLLSSHILRSLGEEPDLSETLDLKRGYGILQSHEPETGSTRSLVFIVTILSFGQTGIPDWFTQNISGGLDAFDLNHSADSTNSPIDVWIPLLGTGEAQFSPMESCTAILEALAKSRVSTSERRFQVTVAVPNNLPSRSTIELADKVRAFSLAQLVRSDFEESPFREHHLKAESVSTGSPEVGRPTATAIPSFHAEPTGDRPIKGDEEDLYGYSDYADAIAAVIRNEKVNEPLLIAIDAPWGVGKTSVANLVKKRLDEQAGHDVLPHQTLYFNAWLHDDAERLPGALIASVAREADQARTWLSRMKRPLRDSFLSPKAATRARWKRRSILIAVLIAFFGFCFLAFPAQIEEILKWFQNQFTSPTDNTSSPENGETTISLGPVSMVLFTIFASAVIGSLWECLHRWLAARPAVSEYVQHSSIGAQHGSLDLARNELQRLIEEVTPMGRKFVIFVDDLERCRPPRAVDLLETINQLLTFPPVVVVIMTDLEVLCQCVEVKYEKLARAKRLVLNDRYKVGSEPDPGFGHEFMRKLVQLEFHLPPIRREVARRALFGANPEINGPASDSTASVSSENAKETFRNKLFGKYGNDQFLRFIGWAVLGGFSLFVLVIGVQAIWGLFLSGDLETLGIYALLTNGILLPIAFGIVSAYGIYIFVWRRIRRRNLYDLDKELTVSGQNSPKADTATITQDELSEIVELRKDIQLASDSMAYRMAREEALDYIQPRPRTIKRVLNRIQMLLVVLNRRGLLKLEETDKAGIPPRVVGKWAAFEERWPVLYRQVLTDPSKAALLKVKTLEDDATAADSLHLTPNSRQVLVTFLRKNGNNMDDHIDDLVHLRHND
ncbi:hypothetical protein EOI86_08760 [Hwanghaeella grinnelliae]|uniref:KAP NTPase domain-containing protein n=1 Tax=Hwanghaeella grinnelliae TaxID=2500179 RepID=A0A437QXS4_9PROT|nr:P-loop NTPase fold protein [Hwanghaeella grinnelliae]RVU39314.1 hypothetical protein EOI86_08760 [Hwanghaeella grinnelliae]